MIYILLKVGWYNACVDKRFELNYPPNTFAVLVINAPSMFETLFMKHMFENYKNNFDKLDTLNDPIDGCLSDLFERVKNKLETDLDGLDDISVETIKDYDIDPGTRRAKIVMQTCAHISGAAYFYDPKKYQNELMAPGKDPNQPVKKVNFYLNFFFTFSKGLILIKLKEFHGCLLASEIWRMVCNEMCIYIQKFSFR